MTTMMHGVMGTIAMVLFFLIFLAILVWVFLKPKREVEREAHLPLEDGPETEDENQAREEGESPDRERDGEAGDLQERKNRP